MNSEKDYLEEVIREGLLSEAEKIEKEVGLSEEQERIPTDIRNRIKMNLDSQIKEYEKNKAYENLSEEDREALRIGKEILEKKESGENDKEDREEDETVSKVVRKKRSIRRLLVLAAVLIMMLAFGITSVGGPERILQFVKTTVGDRQVTKVNSSDENKVIEKEIETEAYNCVKQEFGIEPVKIIVRPDGMKFEKMIFDKDLQIAELYYQYNNERVVYMISASYGDTSWGYDVEDKVTNHYYQDGKKCSIEVKEYETPETKTKRYSAEFEYNKIAYYLIGTMNQEEFDNILKNLHFSL